VLAMDEMPHDKAPLRMHEPRGGNNRATVPAGMNNPNAPLNLGDSQEMTAINAKPPQKGGYVIEGSKARPGDDDPTKLMVREEAKGKGDSTKQGVGPSAGHRTPVATNDTTKEAAIRDSAVDTKADASIVRRHQGSGNKLPWIIIAVVLVLAAAATGLYFGGILKL
jgi:hypothetical protein